MDLYYRRRAVLTWLKFQLLHMLRMDVSLADSRKIKRIAQGTLNFEESKNNSKI